MEPPQQQQQIDGAHVAAQLGTSNPDIPAVVYPPRTPNGATFASIVKTITRVAANEQSAYLTKYVTYPHQICEWCWVGAYVADQPWRRSAECSAECAERAERIAKWISMRFAVASLVQVVHFAHLALLLRPPSRLAFLRAAVIHSGTFIIDDLLRSAARAARISWLPPRNADPNDPADPADPAFAAVATQVRCVDRTLAAENFIGYVVNSISSPQHPPIPMPRLHADAVEHYDIPLMHFLESKKHAARNAAFQACTVRLVSKMNQSEFYAMYELASMRSSSSLVAPTTTTTTTASAAAITALAALAAIVQQPTPAHRLAVKRRNTDVAKRTRGMFETEADYNAAVLRAGNAIRAKRGAAPPPYDPPRSAEL